MVRDGVGVEDISYVYDGFQKKYADNIADGKIYDKRDLDRLDNDEDYVLTFIRGKERLDEAIGLVHESLKWRCEWKINDLTEDMLLKEHFEANELYFHNHDKDGTRIMLLHVGKHKKDGKNNDAKRFFSHHLEEDFLENRHSQIVMLFDMSTAGLGNLDMDLVKYIINSFKYYYPCKLSYMLIYELPWILNAAWKVIKQWLNEEAVAKVKFITKSGIQEYIDKDQLLLHMGGTDSYEYKYIPREDRTAADGSSTSIKKVTFADQEEPNFQSFDGDDMNSSNLSSETDGNSDINANANTNTHATSTNHIRANKNTNANSELKTLALSSQATTFKPWRKSTTPLKTLKIRRKDQGSFVGRLLTIRPSEELEFSMDANGKDCFETITLSNTLPYGIAFKVKTTSPEKYKVRPSSGLVRAGSSTDVYVYLQQDYHNQAIQKDKFLIMAMEVTDEGGNISELWRKSNKENVMEHRLRCVYTPNNRSPGSSGTPPSTPDQVTVLSKQMDSLLKHTSYLESRLKWVFWAQLFMMFAGLAFAVMLYINNKQSSCPANLF